MMALVDRALALNPSFARGWNNSGLLSLFAGQPERAIEHAEAALRLSPRARVGTTLGVMGTAHLISRRFDEALPKLLLGVQEAPSFLSVIDGSPPATPIWGGSMRREMSLVDCALSARLWFRPQHSFGILSSASCCCRACAWQRARRYEPDPPSRRDPRRRCGGVFAAHGSG
jgi:tetratricopeptide (TPR) repeat protein